MYMHCCYGNQFFHPHAIIKFNYTIIITFRQCHKLRIAKVQKCYIVLWQLLYYTSTLYSTRVSSRGGGGGEASPPNCPTSPPKEKEKERKKGERERKREREREREGNGREHILFGYYDICK